MENLRKRLNKKGFTLVELLVVIAIIAILSVTAYVALGGQTAKARNSRRMQDLSAIQSALEIYAVSHNNRYPGNLTDLVPVQISKIPIDPTTGLEYKYAHASNRTFQLGAYLEDETGGLVDKAYIIGNAGSDIITTGCNYDNSTGTCTCASSCTPTDGDEDCVPYCI
ncbi:type II secretion system protein [Candidatus Peregrinibacteria bacterium]|nr:type II secretion system protein [Candidatus Peregrinibacteria bacterium]